MADHAALTAAGAIDVSRLSAGERAELAALGIIGEDGTARPSPPYARDTPRLERTALQVPQVLNEAYEYEQPVLFSRALRFDMAGHTVLLISGTASVDEGGRTIHAGDFRAQCWRTYRNISALLEAAGMSWRDVVRTTCYLRDIERDYAAFNDVRTAFFRWWRLDPLPASTGIQARLCRDDLLIEIEAIAIAPLRRNPDTAG
jgi:2-iminobutanoate/2-iminopropanoate deaminase